MTNDIDRRKLVLGDQLRLLRESAGLSGKRLAEQVSWQASKLSKLERAKQSITDSDVVTICEALGVPADQTDALRDELRAIRLDEARWNRQLRVGHKAVQNAVARDERTVRHVRAVNLTLVPGLLQTAEYARTVFVTLSELHQSERDTDAAVRARIERQQVLYDSAKQIELLMTEASLRYPIAPPSVMLAQIDRLLTVQGLPALRLGIVPLGHRLPAVVMHDFVIRDDTVLVELVNTEIISREPADLTLYNRLADMLWSVAVEGDDARGLLTRIAADLRG